MLLPLNIPESVEENFEIEAHDDELIGKSIEIEDENEILVSKP